MKKVSKRIHTVLLSTILAGQAIPVFAANGQTGGLDIDLHLNLPAKEKGFTVTLTKDGNAVKEQSVKANQDGTQLLYSVDALAPGSYQLEIKGEGYLTYQQAIEITAGFTTKLELYNQKQADAQMGVMAVGDVNGDGRIDKADSEEMVQAIDAGSTNLKYDLNGDRKVDVADLLYITLNYDAQNVSAKPLTLVSGELTAAQESGTIRQGSLGDVTSGKDSFVQFAPTSGSISEANPIAFSLAVSNATAVDGFVIAPPVGSENTITDATILVEDANGGTHEVKLTSNPYTPAALAAATATQESDGTIVVKLGEQIAVKKVTIKVTGASTDLVDIARVEFVNGMENRIPEPQLNVPQNVALTQLSAGNSPSFSVSWRKEVNVTGYEVSVVEPGGQETVLETTATALTVSSLSGKLTTSTPYAVRVRAVNGTWKSPYSDAKTITLAPESVPPAPESVSVEGQIEALRVSWKEMRDTSSYSVYYRAQGESQYQLLSGITENSCTLKNLAADTTYEVYVIGQNALGNSPKSELKQARTLAAKPLDMPKYKLINTVTEAGQKTAHIESVNLNGFLEAADAFAIVDGDMGTYAETTTQWDLGGFNNIMHGPIITLDAAYEMDTIRFASRVGQGKYGYIRAYATDADGNETKVFDSQKNTWHYKTDENDNPYYELQFDQPAKVKKLQLMMANSTAVNGLSLAEVSFYYYDSLANDIEGLFTDATHISLRTDVTKTTLDELDARLKTADTVSGEYHPDQAALQLVLKDAYALLEQNLESEVISVDANVTAKADGHLDFAYTLSDLQPLGRTVQAGETINVYVGAKGKTNGDKTNLKLVFTQNHGEWNQWSQEVSLVVGQNSFEVPNVSQRTAEAGGAIYVRYEGQKGAEQYSVRVSGGAEIPMLDVSGKNDAERTEAIAAYVKELETYVGTLAGAHGSTHDGSYEKTTCVLNYTDLVLDGMMYSVPASAVWDAIQSDPAGKLTKAIAAMEQEIDLLYQHKGLHEAASNSNRYPEQRLNIRYQKMFDGAFMYAGGKHIGIEFGSVGELFGMTPVETDAKGNKVSGQLSGWGIAHEIGHVINNKQYATAEVTNNYYSILATGDTRSDYEKVYRAVTAGGASDEATALAMYWQLHMYYDSYGNYKTFDTTEEQLENLFFARMDSYSRDTASAPQPDGVALTLSGGKSDKLIRLACAAAEENLLPFFDAWGLSYDAATEKYAKQFDAAPAVQYMNPAAQKYQLEGGKGMAEGTKVNASIRYDSTGAKSNQVTLALSDTDGSDAMLGYEIRRNGEVVAFVPADEASYTDTISVGNNRVYQYEVVAYDKLLQKTDALTLAPVKVTHDGTLGKEKWTLTTNMTSDEDEEITADGNNGYCEDTTISAISNLLEDKAYTGTAQKDGAELTVKLGETSQLTALRYQGDAARLKVSVSADGEKWETVYSGQADGTSDLLYFENPNEAKNLYVCEAEYVKLEFPGLTENSTIHINQIDLLAPAGDNVEWLASDSIGILQEDYTYSTGQAIPAGSLVFIGSYQGNPAYNVVLLKDEEGSIIEGSQIILAPQPDADALLGDVADGTWIYWIEPDDIPDNLPEKVMAELYRVDDATTMKGQRMVSDTLYQTVPDSLPPLKLEGLAGEGSLATALLLEEPEQEEVEVPEEPEQEEMEEPEQEEPKQEEQETPEVPEVTPSEPTEPETPEVEPGEPSVPESGEPEEPKQPDVPEVNPGESNQPEEPKADHSEPTDPSKSTQPEIIDAAEEPQTATALQTVSLQGAPTQTVQVQNTQGVPQFTLTAGKGNAKLALHLGDATAQATVALQTAFAVSDGVTGVTMDWAQGVKNAALLKECRYDAKAGVVNLYVTAGQDLLDAGTLDIGTLSMQTESGTKTATLTMQPDSTVLVGSDYVELNVNGMQNPTVKVDMAQGSSSSGSSGGNSSSSKPTSSKEDKKEDATESTPTTTPTTETTTQPAANPFADVTQKDYFYDAVQWAVANGVTSGTSAQTFSPQASCTRAEMVTFLWRAAGKPTVAQTLPFTDVSKDAYYYDAICWAVAEGITSGTTATTFSPNDTVTRGQTVSFLWRANGKPDADGNTFTDVREKDYYAQAVAWAVETGITSGTSATTFSPDADCTRGQIVTFLYRGQK